jgi:signal transduction histidine kinase
MHVAHAREEVMGGRKPASVRHRLDGGRSHAVQKTLEPLLLEVRQRLGASVALAVYQSFSSQRDICLLAGSASEGVQLPLPNEPLFFSHGFATRHPSSTQDLVLTSTARRFRLELAAALLVPWRDASGRGWLIAGPTPHSWNHGVLDLAAARDFIPLLREAHLRAGLEGTVKLQGDVAEAVRFVSEASLETDDVSSILEAVVVAARTLLGTDVAYVSLPEDDPDYFHFTTLLNIRTSAFRRLRVRLGEGLGGFTREQMRTIRSLNYAEDTRLRHAPVVETVREGILSAMCTPLVVDSTAIGLLYVGNRHLTPFTETDVALVEDFAGYATLGIRRAQIEHHRETVMRRREKERLASTLHDSVVRSLMEIGFQAEEGMVIPGDPSLRQRFSIIDSAAEFCLEALRTQLADLTNEDPRSDARVGDVLEEIRSVHRRDSVRTTIELKNASTSTRLPHPVANALSRIAQEAVENAQIHADCEQIRVTLEVSGETIRVAVSDDGRGMAPTQIDALLADDTGHLGLRNMRTTAKRAGGRLLIGPGRDSGLVVEAVLPRSDHSRAA